MFLGWVEEAPKGRSVGSPGLESRARVAVSTVGGGEGADVRPGLKTESPKTAPRWGFRPPAPGNRMSIHNWQRSFSDQLASSRPSHSSKSTG